jgi:ATP phosphoribosyltransferase regulatory subunit
MRWLLPEGTEDLLPAEAARLEAVRRRLLDDFSVHGYEFVMPPLLEFIESLMTGSGGDLDLSTFKLMDQLSGRSMGVRADMTPQIARIDAHLLNRRGVVRLCYCGSVLHTVPAGLHGSREPIQIGAEIYGHQGLEADIEIIRLLARSLNTCQLENPRIDLGHVGIFAALAAHGGLLDQHAESLFDALQSKDIPKISELTSQMSQELRSAFLVLPELYGDAGVIDRALICLDFPGETGVLIKAALAELKQIAQALHDLPICFDLADLRGYRYHNGVAFSAYSSGSASAIARGGRYDRVSQVYDRVRPATGFSLDLRQLVRLIPGETERCGVLAPWAEDASLLDEITRLRESGQRVVQALPGHAFEPQEFGCDRQLSYQDGAWIIDKVKDV